MDFTLFLEINLWQLNHWLNDVLFTTNPDHPNCGAIVHAGLCPVACIQTTKFGGGFHPIYVIYGFYSYHQWDPLIGWSNCHAYML